MAGNVQLIDQLVDPVAIEQILALKKELDTLRITFSEGTKQALLFYNATGNSTNTSQLIKNNNAASKSIDQMAASQEKQRQFEIKLTQQQDKAAADFQRRLEKQAQAEQQALLKRQAAADKEIAIAEAKAAKLQVIADKEIARKAAVQFPAGPSAGYNPVTAEPDVPSTRYEPAITGNENMTIAAVRSAEATKAQSLTLLEQQDVLTGLSASQRANLDSLLALQVEMAANVAELKVLNVETAAGAERAAFLTSEQIRLKVAISEVTVELNRQTKEQLVQEGSVKQLTASLEILRNEYFELGVAERESVGGQAMLVNINRLDTEVKRLRMSVGDTSKEVGAYEKAIAKATSGTALATQAITIATRTIVRMVVQFALFAVIFKAAEALYDYIRALDVFNPIATETERVQKSLVDAFNSADYQKGIESLEKLSANLELAKKGIGSSDNVINEYNETIGKTFGYVNNLTDAQQGFIDNSDNYIRAIYLEAAAQSILADSAKEIGTAMAKNQEDRNKIDKLNSGTAVVMGIDVKIKKGDKEGAERMKEQAGGLEYDIKQRDKRIKEIIENSKKALQNTYKDLDTVPGQTGTKTGSDPAAELANKIANEGLEYQKMIAQNKINNDKLTYRVRLAAAAEFYNASVQIEKNNEALQLKELPAKDARREDVEKAANNKLLSLKISYNEQVTKLNDKAQDQDIQHLKNTFEKKKDVDKLVIDSDDKLLSQRYEANEDYKKQATSIIQSTYEEEVKAAGQNGKALILAKDNQNKALASLDLEYQANNQKIHRDAVEGLKRILKEEAVFEEQILSDVVDDSNEKISRIENNRLQEQLSLSKQYADGLISQKSYQDKVKEIDNKAANDRINQEITTAQAIVDIRTGLLAIGIGDAKGLQGAKKTLSGLKDKKIGIDITTNDDTAQTKLDKQKEKLTEINAFAQETGKALDIAQQAVDDGYQHQIDLLEKKKQALQDNAQVEIDAINNSLASEKSKQDQIVLLNARTKASQDKISAEEAKIKKKQAVFDKAASIAKIIEGTAIAVVNALSIPVFGVALAATIGALGAAQLAVVAAQPLPAYATGTKSAKGGMSVVGELGPEFVRTPTGQVFFTPPTASLMDIPRGSEVLNAMETKRLQNAGAIPKSVNDDRLLDEVRKGNQIAAKNKPRASRPVPWQTQQSAAWEVYERRIFR